MELGIVVDIDVFGKPDAKGREALDSFVEVAGARLCESSEESELSCPGKTEEVLDATLSKELRNLDSDVNNVD